MAKCKGPGTVAKPAEKIFPLSKGKLAESLLNERAMLRQADEQIVDALESFNGDIDDTAARPTIVLV